MSDILTSGQRRLLDTSVQKAREIAEQGAAAALTTLGVAQTHRPGYLTEEQNELRLALRAQARQLGDDTTVAGAPLTNLEREVAYEQWHRLLFARFLEVNGLLRYPEDRSVSVTLDDCADLAQHLGEPDGWSVAARFASEILPGVFRLDDPAVQVRFATEHRVALEQLLQALPEDVFRAEDSLGWVYQFWQTAEKKRVNDSGVKIGGADLSPVTQLFTENYMVRFLLENSLGAWWAGRHPDSPLVDTWEYLRRLDDGTPAAGTFPEWPTEAAKVTVMDPCCGSGHFLVAMFGMLWRMRAEEEGLSPAEAQDAVLRENLFGLELDPRCTQIATFNVALEAWKQGGFRDLPAPQIACSGVRVTATRAEWESLAGADVDLRRVMGRLHTSFRNADTLGSLIDPRPREGVILDDDLGLATDWRTANTLLADALEREAAGNTVLGHAAQDVVHAASLLGSKFTLVATNPPFRTRISLTEDLRDHIDSEYSIAKADIATAFLLRCLRLATTVSSVSPENWLTLGSYRRFRKRLLAEHSPLVVARLGENAFASDAAKGAFVALTIIASTPSTSATVFTGDASGNTPEAKAAGLIESGVRPFSRSDLRRNPDQRITPVLESAGPLLSVVAHSSAGIQTGDSPRFICRFWELSSLDSKWERMQSTVLASQLYGGRSFAIRWESGSGSLYRHVAEKLGTWGTKAWLRGTHLGGTRGVAVSQMRALPVTIHTGELFDNNTAVITPRSPDDLEALWAFCSSPQFNELVRSIDTKKNVTNATLVKVPFNRDHWRKVAASSGPLPEPSSPDPTQWLFRGAIPTSTHPLQVAVARLLGYRWPDQPADALDAHADTDGIVALQSLPGEPDAATRLRALLSDAYGDQWSSTLERQLVLDAGGKSGRLEEWLRDTFFAQHVKVFDNRPFIWHITDGAKDGFHALVNYHRLDHATLEKLTWTILGHWIERQTQEANAGRAGADTRLAKAKELQAKLQLVLDGEAPYDVYVRWKEMHEQPIGWYPDLDDGVRLNIRPFVTAGVLRSRVNVHWRKDRGTNPDGSERLNDLHPNLAERRAARTAVELGPATLRAQDDKGLRVPDDEGAR